MSNASCRFCKHPLTHCFADLGMSPLSNAYVSIERRECMESFYPLYAYVCSNCFLVQLAEFESPEHIFSDYAYFSSYSNSWLAHCKAYTEQMVQRFDIQPTSQVIEIASNDGYLLQYFQVRGIPVLGIEPAANVAHVAQQAGIPTHVSFFGASVAKLLADAQQQADLLIANNVLAHVPNLHDFVEGVRLLLKPDGFFTMEFPHLLELIQHNQFDTIYHEHFSYFSLKTVCAIFEAHALRIFDVDTLPTHGGSLRIYGCHKASSRFPVSERIAHVQALEHQAGLTDLSVYLAFHQRIQHVKRQLLRFLLEAKEQGKTIASYGAPAKGNTLLNYCGIGTDFIEYTVDRSPHKQGCLLPGSRIPIEHPDRLLETKPDYVLILPWNLKDEIQAQRPEVASWGGRWVVPIPELMVVTG